MEEKKKATKTTAKKETEAKETTTQIQIEVKLKKEKLISLAAALLAFIFGFVSWFKTSYEGYYGYGAYSNSFGVFDGSVFDLSIWLGLAKICIIISIIAFVVFAASVVVDIKKLIPAIKFDIDKYAPIAYFGSYLVAVVFGFIACLANYSSYGFTINITPTFGIFAGLIFAVAGIVLTFKPDLLKNIKISK